MKRLQISVDGAVATSQDEINQALILAVSGLLKQASGGTSFFMGCASPNGGWPVVEVSPGPEPEISETTPSKED